MHATRNRQVLLKSRPVGEPGTDNFELVESPLPEAGDGQYLARTIYLSLDPYMRGRMSGQKSYAEPAEVGKVMVGATVSRVVASKNPRFAEGDLILGYDGWQEYAVSSGEGVRKLDPSQGPISYALGVLGMPGLTAYAGLLDVGRPKPGETVVVSAASGAVGSVVGQIAKIKGCRAVGLAGTDEKCEYVTGELGFDACINYKTRDLDQALRETCPGGIDVYYDNVAGPILGAVLRHINVGARIPLVGLISQYNATEPPPGPNLFPLLIKGSSSPTISRGRAISCSTSPAGSRTAGSSTARTWWRGSRTPRKPFWGCSRARTLASSSSRSATTRRRSRPRSSDRSRKTNPRRS